MSTFRGIPVVLNSMVPLQRTAKDGTKTEALAWIIRRPVDLFLWSAPLMLDFAKPAAAIQPPTTRPEIHVHPDRWDAFWMAVNQPDIFAHPEVRALLLGLDHGQATKEPDSPT